MLPLLVQYKLKQYSRIRDLMLILLVLEPPNNLVVAMNTLGIKCPLLKGFLHLEVPLKINSSMATI